MNTKQERAEFEAWAKERGMTLHKASPCDGSPPYYLDTASIAAWEGYQAGRASQQSQDRDALIKLVNACPADLRCHDFHHTKADQHRDGEACKPLERYLEAIDHARRVKEKK